MEFQTTPNPEYVPYDKVREDYARLNEQFLEAGVHRIYQKLLEDEIEDTVTKLMLLERGSVQPDLLVLKSLKSALSFKKNARDSADTALAYHCPDLTQLPSLFEPEEDTTYFLKQVEEYVNDPLVREAYGRVSLCRFEQQRGIIIPGSRVRIGRLEDGALETDPFIPEEDQRILKELFEDQAALPWWPA